MFPSDRSEQRQSHGINSDPLKIGDSSLDLSRGGVKGYLAQAGLAGLWRNPGIPLEAWSVRVQGHHAARLERFHLSSNPVNSREGPRFPDRVGSPFWTLSKCVKRLSPLLVCLLLAGGCASFQSISQESGPLHPKGWAVFDYVIFNFNLNQETVDTVTSYAISPGDRRYPGRRYRIEVEPHIGKNAAFRPDPLEARIHLVRPDGSRLKKIENGVWSFHFVVVTNGAARTVDQRWRIGSTAPSLILGGR